MTNIVIAKRELYDTLKFTVNEVIGAGIKNKDGKEYIVIFVAENNLDIIAKIPREFKGNAVQTEVRSVAYAW